MISTLTYNSALTISVKASQDIPKFRFVDYFGNLCGAGDRALGVSSIETASGRQISLEILGTILVESGGVINKGDAVSSDAEGKAKLAEAGETVNGYALSSSSGVGVIKVRLAN